MATAVATDLIADVLTARRDELVAAADEASVTRIRDADPAPVEDARRHVAQHHDLLCDVLRRGRPVEPQELELPERHAAMRAQRGISLSDFLKAFRTYHAVRGAADGRRRGSRVWPDSRGTRGSCSSPP